MALETIGSALSKEHLSVFYTGVMFQPEKEADIGIRLEDVEMDTILKVGLDHFLANRALRGYDFQIDGTKPPLLIGVRHIDMSIPEGPNAAKIDISVVKSVGDGDSHEPAGLISASRDVTGYWSLSRYETMAELTAPPPMDDKSQTSDDF